MQPFPPVPPAAVPPQGPPARWWLLPLSTVFVVALSAVVWVDPGAGAGYAVAGAVLVAALVGVGACLVRAPHWPDARPVGTGLVWALPIGFTVVLVALVTQ